jgi:glycosyltransferase involved in cell wall biosynthesis
MPKISFIILLHNSKSYSHCVVASLRTQIIEIFKTLFIDGSSSNESLSIFMKRSSGVFFIKLLKHPWNLGAESARSIWAQAAMNFKLTGRELRNIYEKVRAFKRHWQDCLAKAWEHLPDNCRKFLAEQNA